jgi:hypothetical protein
MHRITTCFDVLGTSSEIEALRGAIPAGTVVESLPGGGARISAEGDVDLLRLAEAVRTNCRSCLPMAFSYSTGSGTATPGAFGGGYVLVGTSRVESGHVSSIIHDKLSLNASDALGAVQLAAVEAYSAHDDGNMAQAIAGMTREEARMAMSSARAGDTLGAFVLCEAGDAGDHAEAAGMMRSAARTLESVADALEKETST